jgi:sulfite exporter TauE/SafE
MNPSALAGIFLVGLLGGVHCLGMCGGIVSALAAQEAPGRRAWPRLLAFNAGRIFSYAVAGAVAGLTGGVSLLVAGALPVQTAFYVLANLLLIGLGLYLLGITRYVAALERVGARLWALLRPLLGRWMPANTVPRALVLGALWGWMPCGLVYSVLATALLAGNALGGAAVMLAFGLGTLPNLMFAGFLMRWLRNARAGKYLRAGAAAFVLVMGLVGLGRSASVADHATSGAWCLTPG